MGPRRSQVRQEQRNFHGVSIVSTPWHQRVRFACFSGAGWLLKRYKPALVCAEGGVFQIHLLSELQERKQNEWRDKSAHGISSLLVSSTQTPLESAAVWVPSVSAALPALSRYGGCFFRREVVLQANPADEQGLLCGHSVTK